MKFFTVTALLAAALLSAVLAVPFLPKARPLLVEARVASDVSGRFQIFFDDGQGVREESSGVTQLEVSAESVVYRLPIAPGTYRAFRLDPLDRGGRVVLESLRIVSESGKPLHTLPLPSFQAVQQVSALEPHGTSGLLVVIAPGSDDPQLTIDFATPLVVTASAWDPVRRSVLVVVPIFLGLAAGLFVLDRVPRFRVTVAERARQLSQRPALAIGSAALVAVLASAYPVVFLGKSYVSPNLGTTLLYDYFPTLPGYSAKEVAEVKLSDVGAVMWQHVPFSAIQRRALTGGELPLWNRYSAAGVPLLAQGQSMFGDPLHFLVIAANGASWAWDLKYLMAKWLFAVGLGLTVFTLTRHTAAAMIVAIAAPFIGFFLYRINHPAFFSLCYAPWPLYFFARISLSTTRRALAWNAAGLVLANFALMNSGTVKEAYMLLVSVNFSGGCLLLASGPDWRERVARLATVTWAGVLFVLISSPIWWTFLKTLGQAYTGYNVASAYQIQPTLLLGAFDEIFYRPLMEQNRVFSPSLNFLLLLGLLYFLATLRKQFAHPAAIALAASSLVPLALAFGLVSPQWIVKVPFLSNIAHLDNTFSCVLIVLWSVLAGVGFATAARRLATPLGRSDLIIAGLLLGALVFGWIAFRQAAHRPIFGPTFSVHPPGQVLAISPFIWDYLKTLLVAAVALALLAHGALRRRSCSPARGLLIAACVLALLWRHALHSDGLNFEPFTVRPTERVDFHARSGAMDFARAEHRREPGRGFGFNGNFFPGWTGMYGLETVHGPDALVNPWLRELAGVSGIERLWDWRLYAEAPGLPAAQPFLDLLNVRFYFDLLSKHPVLTQSLKLVKSADLDVYESPTAWPRAFFTPRIETYAEPAELIARLRGSAGTPFAAVQKSDARAIAAVGRMSRPTSSTTATAATAYRLTENATSFRVTADGPGMIVLTEAFWAGDFRAEVNGRSAPILRVNHAFRGVVVDAAGEYEVAIRYLPVNFPLTVGLSISGVTLLGLSLFFAVRRTRLP